VVEDGVLLLVYRKRRSDEQQERNLCKRRNAWTPLCHSRVQTAHTWPAVEVKCGIHVVRTNALFADDISFIGDGANGIAVLNS
jgi:hypothetical protein